MPEFIQQLRLRLVKLGCPAGRLQRMVRELADHREDLVHAATAAGLADSAAQEQADRRLGDPQKLAENLMVTLRQSSWWGRHFLVVFGLLPLLASPLLWALILWAELALEFAIGFGWNDKKLHLASDNPTTFDHWVMAAYGADYVALALVALIICWLARRSGVSLLWMLIACAICSTYALVSYTHVARHSYTIGISYQPQWTRAMMPTLVAGAFCLRHYWKVYVLRRQTAG